MFPSEVLFSEQDKDIQKLLRNFTTKEIIPLRKKLDEEEGYETADAILKKLKDIGIQSMFVPEQYGGAGCVSAVTGCIMCEELARGDAGIAISQVVSTAPVWFPLAVAQNKTLSDIIGPQCCGDEVISFSVMFTEPNGGADAELRDMQGRTMKTTARLEGDEYVINGQKNWPTNAGREPGWLWVACTTNHSLGDEGIAVIYVPVPSKGLSFGKPEKKLGYRSCRNASVYFDNVRVPKEYRVAGPGMDANIYYGSLGLARLVSGAMSVGVAQSAFDMTLEYTQTRSGGGKFVRQHSIVAGIIADMAIGIETARAAIMSMAFQVDHPEVYGPPWSDAMAAKLAMARIYACETAEKVTSKCLELTGAAGISSEYPLEKCYRDAKTMTIPLGGMVTNRLEVCKGYYDFNALG